MDAEVLIAGAAIAFLAAACYSVTGFGFALVMTPLLALAWETKPAVVSSVLLSTIALLPLLFQVRGHVDVPRVSVLVVGSLAGIPVGVFLLESLDADALNILIAVTVIVASLALYFAPSIGGSGDSVAGRLSVGFTSGALGASTSMGGPPVVLYMLGRETETTPFRATLLAYFLPGNLLTIAAFALVGQITGDFLLLCAVALPAVVLGLLAGGVARRYINAERFRAFVVAVLVVTAVSVLVSTISG